MATAVLQSLQRLWRKRSHGATYTTGIAAAAAAQVLQ
jgi:hypothetical protein